MLLNSEGCTADSSTPKAVRTKIAMRIITRYPGEGVTYLYQNKKTSAENKIAKTQ
jgi:hypothetical protein